MRAVKISLAVIVLAAIGLGVFLWIDNRSAPGEIKLADNQFTARIEQDIEQIKAKPDNAFCGEFYREVSSRLNGFYKQSKLGTSQSENDQRKEDLEKRLYSVYAEKFIMQAKFVLNGSEWNYVALKFIREEMTELKKSTLLMAGSPVADELATLQTALDKYWEISGFIATCNGFTYSNTTLASRFPVSDVQGKIQKAALYKSQKMQNEYVNNCSRLHNSLNEIPLTYFRAHVRYLDNKISYWSGKYSQYASQRDFASNLGRPLEREIKELDNDVYHVSGFSSQYDRLLRRWSDENLKAYKHNY